MGLILLEPPPDWLPGLSERFIQRKISLTTLADTRKMHGPYFVKPAEGKVFEARVYARPEELPDSSQVDDGLNVLISEPVTWQLEVRCFVVEGRVATLSPYWRAGQLAEGADGSWPFRDGEEARATEFARTVLDAVAVPPGLRPGHRHHGGTRLGGRRRESLLGCGSLWLHTSRSTAHRSPGCTAANGAHGEREKLGVPARPRPVNVKWCRRFPVTSLEMIA